MLQLPKSVRSSNILCKMEGPRTAVIQQPKRTPFPTNSTLLHATKKSRGERCNTTIHPHASGFKTQSNTLGLCRVSTPHRSAEALICIICAPNNVLLVLPLENRHDRTERLILYHAGVLWWVGDNGWRNEISRCLFFEDGGSQCEFVGLALAVVKDGLDFLVLHLVLDGA